MYQIVFLLLSSFLLMTCRGVQDNSTIPLPYYNEPTFTPIFLTNKSEIEKTITHTIQDFSFLNEDSLWIDQERIKGRIHVANFIFTTCGSICPTMTKNMKIVSDSLSTSKNIVFLSYSITPWIDKPAILHRYKMENHIQNPNWHFLTGNKSAIYNLARQSYFAEEAIGFNKDSSQFLHTEHCILVDKSKRIRGIYNGTLTLEMKQLIEDIKTLEKE